MSECPSSKAGTFSLGRRHRVPGGQVWGRSGIPNFRLQVRGWRLGLDWVAVRSGAPVRVVDALQGERVVLRWQEERGAHIFEQRWAKGTQAHLSAFPSS